MAAMEEVFGICINASDESFGFNSRSPLQSKQSQSIQQVVNTLGKDVISILESMAEALETTVWITVNLIRRK